MKIEEIPAPLETEFKTSSQDELNLLEILNSVKQLDFVNLRQIFLLLTRDFYSDPKAFNADSTDIANNLYKYTYSNKFIDPLSKNLDTIDIELGYSSSENSVDKTDYLKNNQKPSIYIDMSDFNYSNVVIDQLTNVDGDNIEKAVIVDTNIIFSHYANTYDDAAKLASLTTSYFTAMRNYLINNLKLIDFMPVSLKPPQPQIADYKTDAQKYFISQATFNLKFESNYKVKQEAVLIKKFTIKLANDMIR